MLSAKAHRKGHTMPSFDAAVEIEDLDYDFSKFTVGVNAELADQARGIIPEPSGDQIKAFREVMLKVYPTKEEPDSTGVIRTVLDTEAIRKRTKDTDQALEIEVQRGLAKMCSEKPSYELISAMPWRVQQAFFGFIYGVFFNPEG
jgi:hypothetical protein